MSCSLILQVGTGQGSVCTLQDSALAKKSSIMVCDSFKVNMLLVSPDKRWIAAGTKDNSDCTPKVCTVFLSSSFNLSCVFVYYLIMSDSKKQGGKKV